MWVEPVRRVLAAFAISLSMIAVCASTALAQAPPSRQARAAISVRAQAAQREAPASPYDKDALAPEYRIAPGDTLQVSVWKEPELSREVRVRPDGYLTVPLLGDVFAVAKTPQGLAAELAERLGRFIAAPQVTITVTFSSNMRFFVVGEVAKPGDYPLLGRTTILQALALAGGFREYAKTEEIRIIRQEPGLGTDGRPITRELVIPVNYKSLAQGQALRFNVILKPGDTIVVP
jgi:polysaccharide export outer membrane protein